MGEDTGYSDMSNTVSAYLPPSPSLEERLEDLRDTVKANDGEISGEAKEEVRTFFLVSQALIEERTGSLLLSNLIKDSKRNPELHKFIMEGGAAPFSQTTREALLQRGEVISGELCSKLQKVRGARNDVAHDYNYHTEYEWDVIEEKAELAVEAFNELLALSDDVT